MGKCNLAVQTVLVSFTFMLLMKCFFSLGKKGTLMPSCFVPLWRREKPLNKTSSSLPMYSADKGIELRHSEAFINCYWKTRGSNTFMQLVDAHEGWTLHTEENIYRKKHRDGRVLRKCRWCDSCSEDTFAKFSNFIFQELSFQIIWMPFVSSHWFWTYLIRERLLIKMFNYLF